MKLEGKKLVDEIVRLADSKKGDDIKVMDLKELDYVADYFIVMSGSSSIQVRSIADYVEEELKKSGIYPFKRQQDNEFNWVLLDYSDVVVHFFEQSAREFYALERLWGDAKFLSKGTKEKKVPKGKKKNAGKSKKRVKKVTKKKR